MKREDFTYLVSCKSLAFKFNYQLVNNYAIILKGDIEKPKFFSCIKKLSHR
jgi:hypothetical protein